MSDRHVADRLYVPENPEHIYPPLVMYTRYWGGWCRAEYAGTLYSMTGAHPTPVYWITPHENTVNKEPHFVTIQIGELGECRATDLMSSAHHDRARIVHCAWISDHYRRLALKIVLAEMERCLEWRDSELSKGAKFDARTQEIIDAGEAGFLVNESPRVLVRMAQGKSPETQENGDVIYHTETRIDEKDAPQQDRLRSGYLGIPDDYSVKMGWQYQVLGQEWQATVRTKHAWMTVDKSDQFKPEFDLLHLAARRLRDLLGLSELPSWPK